MEQDWRIMSEMTYNEKWSKSLTPYPSWKFTINTVKFIVHITGGSVVILDKKTGATLNQIKGYTYLYTGDVNPDETELFALENGKHFYIISLEDFTQKLRVTLPRFYESIDVYGNFSSSGEFLYVPVYRYKNKRYEYCLCTYETKSYSLVSMEEVPYSQVAHWI